MVTASSRLDATALEAEGVCVSRGHRRILDRVSLRVQAGEALGVLGPSGAGKSTLFRALAGEAPPDAGVVLLAGEDVTKWPLWRRARAGVGYVPQGPSVLWDLTVAQNLAAFRSIAGLERTAVSTTASIVGLENRLDVRAVQLSAGERRRLEVARALTRGPRVILCDEPFAGVDPAGARLLGDLLRSLAAAGAAVILADHHVAETLRVCSRALLLLDGAVVANATAEQFCELPIVRSRYLLP